MMMKGILVFSAAFGLCAALGWATAGCFSSCDCPEAPADPEPQALLPITEAKTFDAQGNEASLTIDPVGGTLDVKIDSIVIRYEQAGVQHEVIYALTGPQ